MTSDGRTSWTKIWIFDCFHKLHSRLQLIIRKFVKYIKTQTKKIVEQNLINLVQANTYHLNIRYEEHIKYKIIIEKWPTIYRKGKIYLPHFSDM